MGMVSGPFCILDDTEKAGMIEEQNLLGKRSNRKSYYDKFASCTGLVLEFLSNFTKKPQKFLQKTYCLV